MAPHTGLVDRLLARLRQVRDLLGLERLDADAETRFADALDSMGFVEFLALVAEDGGVSVETIEQAAGRHYGRVGELAAALDAAGLRLDERRFALSAAPRKGVSDGRPMACLASAAARLPVHRQLASEINAALGRPSGWLEEHAGIESRCLWNDEDPLTAAAAAAHDCLQQAGLSADALGALLVTSEAPPLLTGLAAALHTRIGLASSTVALEIGGACTGFLAALWTACRLLVDSAAVLVIAVEAPSRWLSLAPTSAGEAAALFGDGAAACLLTAQSMSASALPVRGILLGTDGSAGSLLRSAYEPGSGVLLHMEGVPLAHRAVRTMADAVRQLSERHGLTVDQLGAIVAHGGNGRMPALLARRLSLPIERVWSATARLGNLGSASVPIAWSLGNPSVSPPVMWTSVGAGLQWGAVFLDIAARK